MKLIRISPFRQTFISIKRAPIRSCRRFEKERKEPNEKTQLIYKFRGSEHWEREEPSGRVKVAVM